VIIYDFNPNNIPDEYLKAIGRIMLCAAQAEDCVRTAIGVFLKIDNVETLALTTQLSTPLKNKILRAVAELNSASASMVDDLDDILDNINAGMERRNAVAHRSLCKNPESNEILIWKEKVRDSIELELKPITVNELNEIADNLLKASDELTAFLGRVGGPRIREGLLREPLNRTKTARAKRRAQHGAQY
jgi:hypothetical protein